MPCLKFVESEDGDAAFPCRGEDALEPFDQPFRPSTKAGVGERYLPKRAELVAKIETPKEVSPRLIPHPL